MSGFGSMALSWLLTFLVHSTLLLALAALVTDRLRSERMKEWVWKVCLCGSLFTAFLQLSVGVQPLGGQIRLAAAAEVQPEPISRFSPEVLGALMRQHSHSDHHAPAHSDPAPHGAVRDAAPIPARVERGEVFAPAALGLWALGGLLAALTFGLGWWHLHRRLSDREWVGAGPLRSTLDELEAQSGVGTRVDLYRSHKLTSPLATGFLRPRICVPTRCEELSPAAQRVMLAHELAHLVRRDPLWLTFARGLETIFFVQPLLRVARRRLEESSEFLCDAWAVERTGDRIALAECLTEVARWVVGTPRPVLACGMASARSPLARRVKRILEAPPETDATWRGPVLASVLVATTVFVAPSVAKETAPEEATARAIEEEAADTLAEVDVPDGLDALDVEPTPTTRDRSQELRQLLVTMRDMEPMLQAFQGQLDLLQQQAENGTSSELLRERLETVQRRLNGLLSLRDRVLVMATQMLELTASASSAPLPDRRDVRR